MQSLVEVYSAADAIEASAVCDLLEEAGIHAHVVGENLQSSLGAVPQGNVHPRIWTNDDDAPRARQLLHAWSQLHHNDDANPKRELLQFSLRAIFVVVTTSALLAACYRALGGNLNIFIALTFNLLFVSLLVAAYVQARWWRRLPDATEDEMPDGGED